MQKFAKKRLLEDHLQSLENDRIARMALKLAPAEKAILRRIIRDCETKHLGEDGCYHFLLDVHQPKRKRSYPLKAEIDTDAPHSVAHSMTAEETSCVPGEIESIYRKVMTRLVGLSILEPESQTVLRIYPGPKADTTAMRLRLRPEEVEKISIMLGMAQPEWSPSMN